MEEQLYGQWGHCHKATEQYHALFFTLGMQLNKYFPECIYFYIKNAVYAEELSGRGVVWERIF